MSRPAALPEKSRNPSGAKVYAYFTVAIQSFRGRPLAFVATELSFPTVPVNTLPNPLASASGLPLGRGAEAVVAACPDAACQAPEQARAGARVLGTEDLPAIAVPSAWMFASKTLLANIHAPASERIWLPAESLPASGARVTATRATRSLFDYGRGLPRRTRPRLWAERLRLGARLDLGETRVYDSRWIYAGNIAHMIHDHMAALGLIRRLSGLGPEHLTVVVEPGQPALVRQIFERFGYRCLERYGPVTAEFVDLEGVDLYQRVPFLGELAKPARVEDRDANGVPLPRKLYIARRGSRYLENEAELLPLLAARGFDRVYMEDHALETQWALLRHASQVVGIHGAGLSALAFRAPERRPFALLELFPAGFVSYCYRRYAAALGGAWVGCRGEITERIVAGLQPDRFDPIALSTHAFRVDPETLEMALDALPDTLSQA